MCMCLETISFCSNHYEYNFNSKNFVCLVNGNKFVATVITLNCLEFDLQILHVKLLADLKALGLHKISK